MANGKPRDHVSTDLNAGLPVISATADPLALRVARLMSLDESDHLYNSLQWRIARSPAFSEWDRIPPRFLSELDPTTAAAIEVHLAGLHQRMLRQARARGWDLELDGLGSGDISEP